MLSGQVLFDDVLNASGRFHDRSPKLVALIVLVLAAGVTSQVAHMRLDVHISVHMVYLMKTEIFTAPQRLSLGFFAKKQTGALMMRVNHDSMNLDYFFIDRLPYFVVNAIQILAIVGAMIALWRSYC